MNKVERLFHMVTLLRSRRTAMTADVIADTMGVSVRTVYAGGICRTSRKASGGHLD